MSGRPPVEAAIRDLTARRLARAYLGLAVLGALAFGEWLLTGMGASLAFWALLGTPTSAGALLAVGGSGADVLLLGGACTVLGLRLLRDTLRVSEVGRLGAVMAIPASDESRG